MASRLIRFFLVLIGLIGIVEIILFLYQFDWSGFGLSVAPDGNIHPEKTLWDWLELALVPFVLFFLAQWYSRWQSNAEHKRQQVNEQYQLVHSYFDRIQSLVLNNNLLQAKPGDATTIIARALTRTAFEQIDGTRKAAILFFLDELKLIQGSSRREPQISLMGTDLSGTGAPTGAVFMNFVGADLRFANLSGVKLDMPNFGNADLMGAEVGGASIVYGNFKGTNLEGTFLTGVNLYGAKFDQNTTLPNGQKWNGTDLTEFGAVLIPPITDREGEEVRRELRYPDEDSS